MQDKGDNLKFLIKKKFLFLAVFSSGKKSSVHYGQSQNHNKEPLYGKNICIISADYCFKHLNCVFNVEAMDWEQCMLQK